MEFRSRGTAARGKCSDGAFANVLGEGLAGVHEDDGAADGTRTPWRTQKQGFQTGIAAERENSFPEIKGKIEK